jgi:tetratricopeptide (TPR) repeat protein
MSGRAEEKSKLPIFLSFVVGIVAFAVYIPALSNGFVNWDDQGYIYNNAAIRQINADFLRWVVKADVLGNYHPLTMLSHAVDYALYKLNPAGHHLTSVILHALNTVLVFFVTLRLVSAASSVDGQSKPRPGLVAAFATALLFAVHPLHVESVAWASERKDVLYAFFYLLAVIWYLRYAAGSRAAYAVSLVFFILSLLSKPMAITLPLVLLIIDHYPLKKLSGPGRTQALVEKIPFVALSMIFAYVTVFTQAIGGALDMARAPLAERLLVAARGYVFYIYKTLWPLELAQVYPYPTEINFLSLEYAGSVIFLVIVTAFAIYMLTKKGAGPYIALLSYYVLTLLPVIGIVQAGTQSAADRYAYLPGVAIFVLVGLAIERYSSRKSLPVFGTVFLLIVVLLGLKTASQTRIWRDGVTFWTNEINLYPESNIGFHNRGLAYRYEGRHDEAIADFDRALRIDPSEVNSYIERGAAYLIMGRTSDAVADFSRAIEIDSDDYVARVNRAVAFASAGDYERAESDFDRAIKLRPAGKLAYFERGLVRMNSGRSLEAVEDFTLAIEIDPIYPDAYLARGSARLSLGKLEAARADLASAIRYDPDYGEAYFGLAVVYGALGDAPRAKASFDRAKELGYNPGP